MYENLVKRLRDKAGALDYDGWVDTAGVMEQAADAIEELNKELEKFHNPEGFSCRNETIEHLNKNPKLGMNAEILYRIALNIAEVADQLAEQNKYIIASPKEY